MHAGLDRKPWRRRSPVSRVAPHTDNGLARSSLTLGVHARDFETSNRQPDPRAAPDPTAFRGVFNEKARDDLQGAHFQLGYERSELVSESRSHYVAPGEPLAIIKVRRQWRHASACVGACGVLNALPRPAAQGVGEAVWRERHGAVRCAVPRCTALHAAALCRMLLRPCIRTRAHLRPQRWRDTATPVRAWRRATAARACGDMFVFARARMPLLCNLTSTARCSAVHAGRRGAGR